MIFGNFFQIYFRICIKKCLTNKRNSVKILLALDQCSKNWILISIFSWRSTQVAEEAPLLRV